MNWPTFMATHLLQREPYWLLWAYNRGLLHRPRTMRITARSILIYTDTTLWSFGVHVASSPPQQVYQAFTDQIPIAAAEIAAALFALNWVGSRLRQPTNITLATDTAVTYYTLSTGKGYTMRFNVWLQTLYIAWFRIKLDSDHGLVVRWVPSAANPADPVSRGRQRRRMLFPCLSDDRSLHSPASLYIGCERVYESTGREAREQRGFP
jgi:hypothetical protein